MVYLQDQAGNVFVAFRVHLIPSDTILLSLETSGPRMIHMVIAQGYKM